MTYALPLEDRQRLAAYQRARISHAELKARLRYLPGEGTFYWIVAPRRHAELLGKEAGSQNFNWDKPYHQIQIDRVTYRRSRLAFLYMEGRWPAEHMDHINGDSLDDRWSNLREATPTENSWNRHKRAKSTDLPMGVRATQSGRFSARICVRGTAIQIGTFVTVDEARSAYLRAREEHYGEFA